MGARNPDTVRPPPDPCQAVTLAEMRTVGWTVRAVCPRCRIALHVDLAALATLLGGDYVLWGRHPQCRVWAYGVDERCEGRILFQVRSIKSGRWRNMQWSGSVADAVRLRSQAGMQDATEGGTMPPR